MTQAERRRYLIRSLMAERAEYRGMALPQGADEQRRLLRSLMNVRPPRLADREFLSVQDDYLRRTLAERGALSGQESGTLVLYASDRPEDFGALAGQFLRRPLEAPVQHVDIERY